MTLPIILQNLRKSWQATDLTGTRINLMREGVLTLVGVKKLESEALFVSAEGGGTLRETAKVEFAGKERYWWIARKVNGVVRRVLLSELKIQNCTVDNPCLTCEVCLLMGGMRDTGDLRTIFSRLKLQDLISAQKYVYDEKFRVRLPDDPTDPRSNPTPFQEVIVPPGTEFPYIVRIIKPSQRDLALFMLGNRVADGLGYGNYSKLRGDATTRWFLFVSGFLHISAHDLLERADKDGKSIEEIIKSEAKSPVGVTADQILTGDDLTTAVDELVGTVKA
jgi:hypothetical protein